jgi:hypothetical protein
MPGGLINIVTYGAQDLFLTGTPEITHFKVVYRRYTNFSVESIRVPFDDRIVFGGECSKILPTIGDLVHQIYLEMVMPQVAIARTLDQTEIKTKQTAYNDALVDLNKVGDFMNLNFTAYRDATNEYLASNDESITSMRNVILQDFNISGGSTSTMNEQIVDEFTVLINGKFDINDVNLNDIAEAANPDVLSKDQFNNKIKSAITISYRITKYYQDIVSTRLLAYNDAMAPNYKFAWVKRLGHAMIKYVDVYIGGEKIDRHYGDWINIWYELTGIRDQEANYLRMIGETPALTTFDRTTKPQTVIQVPLQFWFCRFNGLAIPLVAMEYSDVTISIKFKKANEVSYIEDPKTGSFVNMDDLFVNENIGLAASLLVDYIYLDGPERRKFAQSSHEYMIEQMQTILLDNVQQTDVPIMFDFSHPCKEFIWVTQKNSFIENIDGFTECKWNNYGINPDGSGNPTLIARLEFNGYLRVEKSPGAYFNYVQPYYTHRNTPADGINLYSFSISPEEQQPTGTCNFSRIAKALLFLQLDPKVYNNTISIDGTEVLFVKVYTRNVNVLRIIGGMGGLAFA